MISFIKNVLEGDELTCMNNSNTIFFLGGGSKFTGLNVTYAYFFGKDDILQGESKKKATAVYA